MDSSGRRQDSPIPALHPRLAEALATFRRCGINPTDAEIAWLAIVRRDCDRMRDGTIPWVSGAPLDYAGVAWYPLHRLAGVWYARAYALLEGDTSAQVAALLYAHAHSGPGDASLRKLVTEAQIRGVVLPWLDALPIHAEQIGELCDQLRALEDRRVSVPDEKADDAEMPADGHTRQTAVLMQAYPGLPAEYWDTGLSAHEVDVMLELAIERASGERTPRAYAKAVQSWLRAVRWVWIAHNAEPPKAAKAD
jgi:hypothetical protein